MSNNKKYIPLIVFALAILAILAIVFLSPADSLPEDKFDRDKDGVADKNDLCPDNFGLSTNRGCPKKVKNERDVDKDEIGKDSDPNDFNPCIPNDKCAICDLDGDGWTYDVEIAQRTNPIMEDTDGDGIKDSFDACPLKRGGGSKNGCPSDSDGDGVMDNVDACPNIGKLTASFLYYDLRGCPLVDAKLSKTEGKNELSWKLDGYKGDLELTLTYIQNNGSVEEFIKVTLPANTTSKNLGSLPGKVNGRTITATLDAVGSPDVKFKNASLRTDQFKCSVSKNR